MDTQNSSICWTLNDIIEKNDCIIKPLLFFYQNRLRNVRNRDCTYRVCFISYSGPVFMLRSFLMSKV